MSAYESSAEAVDFDLIDARHAEAVELWLWHEATDDIVAGFGAHMGQLLYRLPRDSQTEDMKASIEDLLHDGITLRAEVARLTRERDEHWGLYERQRNILEDARNARDELSDEIARLTADRGIEDAGAREERLRESEWQSGYVAGNNDAINGTQCGRRSAATANAAARTEDAS